MNRVRRLVSGATILVLGAFDLVRALRELVTGEQARIDLNEARKQIDAANARTLEALAATLPHRTIHGEQGPYLSRYTLAELPGGGHLYLHFFHRGDVDQELHNHPWAGRSLILTGGYREERREGDVVVERVYRPGDFNVLEPDTFHRVDLLDPKAGAWTLFATGQRVQSWGFWDRNTSAFTPWREALARRGLVVPEGAGRD